MTTKWKASDGRTINVGSKKADMVLKLIDRRMKTLDTEAIDLAGHHMYSAAAGKSATATGLQIAFNYILEQFNPKK